MDRWHGTRGRGGAGLAVALTEPDTSSDVLSPEAEAPRARFVPQVEVAYGQAGASPAPSANLPEWTLSQAVAALARKVDVLGAKAVDPVAIARLQRQTGELKELVEQVLVLQARPASDFASAAVSVEFARLASDALARLEARVDTFLAEQARRAPPGEELAALRERLDAVAHDVKALGTAGDPRFAARLDELLERLDRSEEVEAEKLAPLVGVLERHLSALVERVGETQVQVARLDGIETMLQGLTREMQRLQEPDAAEDEAVVVPFSAPDAPEAAGPVGHAEAQGLPEPVAEAVQPAPATMTPAQAEVLPLHAPRAEALLLEAVAEAVEEAVAKEQPKPAPAATPALEAWPEWPTDTRRTSAKVTAAAEPEIRDAPWQVTEAPWQGELRDLLERTEQRRRASTEALREGRASLRPAKDPNDWTARQVEALEAALLEAQGASKAPNCADWIAAADRAEHREKGAALARQRQSEQRASLATRIAAVSLAAIVLGLATWFLVPHGSSRDQGSGLTIAAAPGSAPVDAKLLANLPSPVGPAALKTAALAGDAGAAAEVGIRYADGRGTDVNTAAAMKWLAFAASQGSVPAAYRLGSLYENNSHNLPEARKLYLWAAERGNLRAMHNLGVLYADGIDGKPDWQNAVVWFRKAADLGLRDSQFNLGVIFSRGLAGAVDRAEAWKWFSLAAAQGDTESVRKRDDVAAKAEPGVVDRARAAVTAFVPGKVVESANSTAVKPEWEVAGPADATPRKSASR